MNQFTVKLLLYVGTVLRISFYNYLEHVILKKFVILIENEHGRSVSAMAIVGARENGETRVLISTPALKLILID